jgi:hypothetical protein
MLCFWEPSGFVELNFLNKYNVFKDLVAYNRLQIARRDIFKRALLTHIIFNLNAQSVRLRNIKVICVILSQGFG